MNLAETATARETAPLADRLGRAGVLQEVSAVLRLHGMTLAHVVGPSRLKDVGRARSWVAHVLRTVALPTPSWSEMARLFRRGDHTTLLHAARKGARLIPSYGPMPAPFAGRRLARPRKNRDAGHEEGPPEKSTLVARFLAELAAQHYRAGRLEVGDEFLRVATIVGTKTEEQERKRWTK